MVLLDALSSRSLTDISQRYHISDKTVQRIIDEEAEFHNYHQTTWLPEYLAFEEFKATDIWGTVIATKSALFCHRVPLIKKRNTLTVFHFRFVNK